MTKTFYDEWLATSRKALEWTHHSPVIARGRELTWVETPQDYRVAMVIGDQVGFPTMGSTLLKAEIPGGWHTGRHRHGEEAIHILSGTGFAIIDEARYTFKPGTTLHVPYMSEHQLFNVSEESVLYLSATTMDLDLAVKLCDLQQIEEKGPNTVGVEHGFPPERDQFNEDGWRIALHLENAIDENARRAAGHGGHKHGSQGHRHGGIWILMGGSEADSEETNGFRAKAAVVTNIFEETPKTRSHKHSHIEAMLYVLEGTGYSEIDGQRYDWEAGDAVHVPPKMTVHEHFNDSDARTRTLRIEFGIRYFYESLWKGYDKIELRETVQALP